MFWIEWLKETIEYREYLNSKIEEKLERNIITEKAKNFKEIKLKRDEDLINEKIIIL